MVCLAVLASASWQSPESLAVGRPAHTTPTTVMGGGSPSTWPAARRVAPSLAGAYSTNLKTAFIALSELLGLARLAPESEPCQELCAADNSNIYNPQVYLMEQMVDTRDGIIAQPN